MPVLSNDSRASPAILGSAFRGSQGRARRPTPSTRLGSRERNSRIGLPVLLAADEATLTNREGAAMHQIADWLAMTPISDNRNDEDLAP